MLAVETVLGMMTNLPCNITPSVPGDQVNSFLSSFIFSICILFGLVTVEQMLQNMINCEANHDLYLGADSFMVQRWFWKADL